MVFLCFLKKYEYFFSVLCPEVLFRPSLINKQNEGLAICINKAIMKCPKEARTEFFNKIYISGGSSMFPGIKERIMNEVQQLNVSAVGVLGNMTVTK